MTTIDQPAGDDIVAAFQIENEPLRGRVARLGGLIDEVLTRHAYPEPVAAMLGFNPSKGLYGTTALIIAYIVLPVTIKIIAAPLIWFIRIEAERGSVRDEWRRRA